MLVALLAAPTLSVSRSAGPGYTAREALSPGRRAISRRVPFIRQSSGSSGSISCE